MGALCAESRCAIYSYFNLRENPDIYIYISNGARLREKLSGDNFQLLSADILRSDLWIIQIRFRT